jgi:hypothetical protein
MKLRAIFVYTPMINVETRSGHCRMTKECCLNGSLKVEVLFLSQRVLPMFATIPVNLSLSLIYGDPVRGVSASRRV